MSLDPPREKPFGEKITEHVDALGSPDTWPGGPKA